MRLVVAGAEITTAVVEVIETLQSQPEIARAYLDTIDELTRATILDMDAADCDTDTHTMSRLRVLMLLRRDIAVIASPPDLALEENDIPAVEL